LLTDAKHSLDKDEHVALISMIREYLPFKSEEFDVILYVTPLEHLLSLMKFLKEAKRCLKEDVFFV
jgi:ubiquinone/menaquinone biosynthesis C-methylase UbiE